MIISDLGYFEEVVAEIPSIVGGVDAPLPTDLIFAGISQISSQLPGSIDINSVVTSNQETQYGNASTAVVYFNVGSVPGEASAATSVSGT